MFLVDARYWVIGYTLRMQTLKHMERYAPRLRLAKLRELLGGAPTRHSVTGHCTLGL